MYCLRLVVKAVSLFSDLIVLGVLYISFIPCALVAAKILFYFDDAKLIDWFLQR